MLNELLTVTEAAGILKYHRKTVERWCRSKVLASFKVGRYYRIRRSDLEKFINGGEVQ